MDEAASFLNVKKSWLYEQVRLNRVPSYKVGAFRRFKLTELDEWAHRSFRQSTAESGVKS
jgi:excisionase family DNA binding protein